MCTLGYKLKSTKVIIFCNIFQLIYEFNKFITALLFGGDLHGQLNSRHVGCIDPHCDPVSVVRDAYENARFLCDQYYLASPELILNENNGEQFFIFIRKCKNNII